MLVQTSFSCLLLIQEFWVDKSTLVKGFVQQIVRIIKGSLNMTRLFPFLIRVFSNMVIAALTINARLPTNTCTWPIMKTNIIHNTTTIII